MRPSCRRCGQLRVRIDVSVRYQNDKLKFIGHSRLLLQLKLNYLSSINHKQFILIIEHHTRCVTTIRLEHIQVTTIAVEYLNAFHVTHVHSTATINRDRTGRTKLTGLIAVATKSIDIFSIRSTVAHCIVESTQRIHVAESVYRYPHVKF